MKPKTMILMVVAVGCGLGASYMTSRLLAERNNKPQEVPTVPVLVAKARVPGWQVIKDPEKVFEIKEFPADVAPKKALGSFAEIKDQRLNKPIDEGKPVAMDDVLTNEQSDVASMLLPGQRATAIKVSAESLAGGFILPKSRVDVVCTTRGNESSARIVLQNMLVLAVDTQHQRNSEQYSILGQTVTLAASPEEATKLALAADIGQLRLLLKGHGDTRAIGQVMSRASDLDKPVASSEPTERETVSATPLTNNPLPVLPPVEEKAEPKEETKPAPAVVVAPRKRHVMTIHNGSQKEKAVFHDDDTEDVIASPPTPPKADDTTRTDDASGDEKPADAKKDAAKPADKGAPAGPVSGGTKSPRTKRIQ